MITGAWHFRPGDSKARERESVLSRTSELDFELARGASGEAQDRMGRCNSCGAARQSRPVLALTGGAGRKGTKGTTGQCKPKNMVSGGELELGALPKVSRERL